MISAASNHHGCVRKQDNQLLVESVMDTRSNQSKNFGGTVESIASLASRLKASLSCNGLAVTLQMCQW